MQALPEITAPQAQAIANQLLSDSLGDRFMADFRLGFAAILLANEWRASRQNLL
jgi:hypothetical protein